MEKKDKIGKISKQQFNELSKEDLWFLVSNLQENNIRLEEEVTELKELVKLRTAEKYSPTSEQMSFLFHELEILNEAEQEEVEEKVHVKAHDKKKRKKRDCSSLPASCPVYDVYHTEDAVDSYEKDGIVWKRVEDTVIEKVSSIPSRHVVERHHWAKYAPADVSEKGLHPVTCFKNEKLDTIAAAPSFIADVIVSKFDDALPLYRQEEIFARSGFKMSRQKMAGWVIKYYEQLLPLEVLMKEKIYKSNLILKDETKVQVLDLKGPQGKPSTNSFMHVTVGSSLDDEERRLHELILFEFKEGRCIDTLLEDLRHYGAKGYLMTDGLSGYKHFDEERHAICWVHAVRHFKKALKMDKGCKAAQTLIGLFQQLYVEEDALRADYVSHLITKADFLQKRKEKCIPVIDEFFRYAATVRNDFTAGSEMGKGFEYIFKSKENLYKYLDVFEASPDNNRCELSCRAFAIGRRNWLFAQTVDGADASAFFYSLVETAKKCNLSPSDYLEYVCTFGPYARTRKDWEALLPWNADFTTLEKMREERFAAMPDPKRTKPYILTGFSR